MTFENARAGEMAEVTVTVLVHVGDEALDVEEGDGLLGVDEIADEEAGPGVAGARVRGEEDVVGEDGDVALDAEGAEEDVVDAGEMFDASLDQHENS